MFVLPVGKLLAQRCQFIFLAIEFAGVTLRQRAHLGAPLERREILAQALLVLEDGVNLALGGRDLLGVAGDLIFLLHDWAKRALEPLVHPSLVGEERDLVGRQIAEQVIRAKSVDLLEFERRSLLRLDLQAEAIGRRGGFFGLGSIG